jgi:hypothetical protein
MTEKEFFEEAGLTRSIRPVNVLALYYITFVSSCIWSSFYLHSHYSVYYEYINKVSDIIIILFLNFIVFILIINAESSESTLNYCYCAVLKQALDLDFDRKNSVNSIFGYVPEL